MLTYKTTITCAFALIGSVSAGLIPTDIVSDIIGSVAVQDSAPTDAVSGIINSVSAQAQETTPTDIVSAVVGSASDSIKDAVPNEVTAVVDSIVTSGKPFPTDFFPEFTPLTQFSCIYESITISPVTNSIDVAAAQAASMPSFTTSSILDGEYLLILIDPDVGSPQTIHFMQPGMVSASNSTSKSKSVPLTPSEPAAVKYIGPTPQAGTGPHRYTWFLFPQPEDFTLSDSFDSGDRHGFDLLEFAEAYGLGAPIAGAFFLAENKLGNLTNAVFGNGTRDGNATHIGKSYNGTIIANSHGNSTNGTLHGSFLHNNGTSNGTIHNGNHNANGTSSGNNGTSSSSNSGSNDGSSSGSSTGNFPVSPSSVVDVNESSSKSSAYAANFALVGFIALVSVAVVSM